MSLYAPVGGETCQVSPETARTDCPTALEEMARFHWSYINRDFFAPAVAQWRAEGCYATLSKRMGYRFRLLKAAWPDSLRAGGTLSASLTMINDGWARPYNPRVVELVLRHAGSGALHRIPVGGKEIRLWLPGPGETKTLTVTGALPPGLPTGSYAVFLNLPDPAERLGGRPEYSIRLANQGTWESASGFNSMLHAVRVLPAPVSIQAPGKRAGGRRGVPGVFPSSPTKGADGKVGRDIRGRTAAGKMNAGARDAGSR
jgi:hypothetical protein